MKHFHTDIHTGLPALPPGVRCRTGQLDGTGKRFGIAAARFNIQLTSALVSSAVDALLAGGVRKEDIEIVWVPGSFELPLTLKRLSESARFDALLACGVVLEGATRHAELILNALSQSFVKLSLDLNCPIVDAVISAHTPQQAEARCLGGSESRGAYAARAALELSTLFPSPIS